MRNNHATQLIFELSTTGRSGVVLPQCDVPVKQAETLIPDSLLQLAPPPLPEVTEPEVIRHFTNLSTLNMSVDTHYYPLGSCTMKYNPKRNERIAAWDGLAQLHPYQSEASIQGMLQLLFELQQMLGEISGLPAVSLQPAAGAHGELTALMVAAAFFRQQSQHRTKVLAPDSAHGTNPASARMAGFDFVTIRSQADGRVDVQHLKENLGDDTAVFMITNPSTLGLFDDQVQTIADLVHDAGGLIYLDGANMNAILGITRPGDFGADMMHFNPHKTFSGPHGGGGPGAGPICVTETLRSFLPCPTVAFCDESQMYFLDDRSEASIGRVRSFFGNVGVLVRAYCYIRTHGPDGLKRVSETAVLNANYLLSQVKQFLDVPHGDRCMHEFVASASPIKETTGLKQPAMDIAKRLLDYGFHPPTVYFPLTVPEGLMMEPTETESKQTLDAFAATLRTIAEEPAETLRHAPHTTKIRRPDEVMAARKPIVKWTETAD
ncbi:MAG: aminomethyl-transferring glycine dehydrogenase subunit GcvPB [Planctomycetaceae bacterium]|nr:glycine dehydrogenase (aminomethyl-transferring) [Planctomycetaceae bacterium]|tara:strand:+ start:450 stop:1922 length:1473 start_codon:yes stop_codon:yes gene_type:complete